MIEPVLIKPNKTPRVVLVNDELAPHLEQFLERYPDDEFVFKEIIEERLAAGDLYCRKCQSPNVVFSKNKSLRNFRCLDCRTRCSVTAGTFFHRVTYPIAWRAAMFLKDENISISENCFAEIVGISQSATHRIYLRILDAVNELMPAAVDALGCFHFLAVVTKRSVLTESQRHPRFEKPKVRSRGKAAAKEAEESEKSGKAERSEGAENSTVASTAAASPVFENIDVSVLTESERKIVDILSSGIKSISEICQELGVFDTARVMIVLTLMELSGIVKQSAGNMFSLVRQAKSTTGTAISLELRGAGTGLCRVPNCKICTQSDQLMSTEEDLASFLSFISGICHGVSRKYLQLYLCWQYFRDPFIRVISSREPLIRICLRRGYVGSDYLRKYVSPELVRFRPPIRGVAC